MTDIQHNAAFEQSGGSAVGVAQAVFLVNRAFVLFQKRAVLTTNLHSTH